jgi:hypothetical protein
MRNTPRVADLASDNVFDSGHVKPRPGEDIMSKALSIGLGKKVMKRVLLAGRLLLCLMLVYVGMVIARYRTVSLDGWVSQISRPGYTLLDAEERDSHFIAVFRTDKDVLAVFTRRIAGPVSGGHRLEASSPDGQGLVLGTAGHILRRDNRMDEFVLDLLGPYSRVEGELWRITPEYKGAMRLSITGGNIEGERFQYKSVVDWESSRPCES